jgi:unsaturated rhamnogalacturonyl hydrolase
VKSYHILAVLFTVVGFAQGIPSGALQQPGPISERAANAAIARWPDGRLTPAGTEWTWNYELGALLEGMDAMWMDSADGRYFSYIKDSVDRLVSTDGSIPAWKQGESQLDDLLLGRQLLLLYHVTQEQRYATAATLLYRQLMHQPRGASGGFWHKQKYPNQMWLDGLYMAEPFYAEYASTFHHPEAFADVARQFALMDEKARNSKTGLLYHGWDESKHERWADRQTGHSAEFWARGMGWHMMALVDTLDSFPEDNAERKQLIASLQRDAAAVARYQDGATGLWYQVLDKGTAKGNYLEASASCMFVYALAKGVRRGYLPLVDLHRAERGYRGVLEHFIQTGPGDDVTLTGTVKSAGLGGDPYRDGSYAYYVGEKTIANDPKGVGAFLLASTEMENAANFSHSRGHTVLLDAWFNSQKHADATGRQVFFHYKWDDLSNSGYSFLGHIFRNFGAVTETLYQAPTRAALGSAQVYIIVSPDIPAKNPTPHYMQPEDADQIAEWVKAGGVLVLMENDPANADIEHLNLLADRFGIHFNDVLRNRVDGNQFDMGKVTIQTGGPIFQHAHTAFMKEVCTISVQPPSVSVLRDHGDVLMAIARYGKGTVFATVDPWLYNEYTDGRKLPAAYDNYAAGQDLVRWILAQVPGR